MTLRIGNGAGFLGDQLDAPRRLAESSRLDYLTLEYLAELTMSILARLREKNSDRGYANDFLEVLRSLLPALRGQAQLHIVTNAGGVHPRACLRESAKLLAADGWRDLLLGMVTGDDLMPQLAEHQAAGWSWPHLSTGEPFPQPLEAVVAANAYLGAAPIAEALRRGARLVVTGRVADASLTVGPCLKEFGWSTNDWKRLSGASVAGHLIECGSQVTGGYSTRWHGLDLANVGYPIAELEADGSAVLTKPAGSGGVVDRLSVAQQLTYEIGDPAHYLTPDVDVDFTTVELEEIGRDRVRVTGASGSPPPSEFKVSLAYRSGYSAAGQLLFAGSDATEKAHAAADIVLQRLRQAGWSFDAVGVEVLGAAEPKRVGLAADSQLRTPYEVVLRVAVRDARREAVEQFTRAFAPLITSGPAGIAGYAAGRPQVVPVFAYWPTTIPRSCVTPQVNVMTVADCLC